MVGWKDGCSCFACREPLWVVPQWVHSPTASSCSACDMWTETAISAVAKLDLIREDLEALDLAFLSPDSEHALKLSKDLLKELKSALRNHPPATTTEPLMSGRTSSTTTLSDIQEAIGEHAHQTAQSMGTIASKLHEVIEALKEDGGG